MKRRSCIGFAGIFIFVMMLAAQLGLCAEERVAVVDMEYLLRQFHKSKSAEVEIERQKKEFVAEIERMQVKLRELEGLFRAAREATREKGLTDSVLQAKLKSAEQTLMDVKESEKRIQLFAQRGKSELLAQSERMRKTLVDQIREAVQTYAKEKGLLVVIDSSGGRQRGGSAIVYRAASVDISADVIGRLNRDNDARKKGGKR